MPLGVDDGCMQAEAEYSGENGAETDWSSKTSGKMLRLVAQGCHTLVTKISEYGIVNRCTTHNRHRWVIYHSMPVIHHRADPASLIEFNLARQF